MNRNLRQTLLPLLAAMIWGAAFVFQSMSADILGAFTYTAARSAIATVALFVVLRIFAHFRTSKEPTNRRKLFCGGICCGTLLTISTVLQQIGIADTSAGKTAFITALYIVIVPTAGLFIGRRLSKGMVLGVALAVGGLYCLCVSDEFSIAPSDIVILLCAFGFSAHILTVDYFARFTDGIALSCVQFATETVICTVCAFLFETPTLSGILACTGSLLYVGVLSSAVAYTLQIIAQKDANPTVVSLLLSLEALFGAISGALFLNETLTSRETIGCVLMLAAIVFAQLPEKKK